LKAKVDCCDRQAADQEFRHSPAFVNKVNNYVDEMQACAAELQACRDKIATRQAISIDDPGSQ
jgi:hypothetical protein